MGRQTIELEQRQDSVLFAVYSYREDGSKTLLECFSSFELASQRFPDARLNLSRTNPGFSQDASKRTG